MTESGLVSTPATVETAPPTSPLSQEESADPKNMQQGSPIEMMPSIGIPEQSLTTRLIGTRPPVAEVSHTLASCSSSSERLDYLRDDLDWIMYVPRLIAASSHT